MRWSPRALMRAGGGGILPHARPSFYSTKEAILLSRMCTTNLAIAAAVLLVVGVGTSAAPATAAGPAPQTLAAYRKYVASIESQIRREEAERDSFLGLQTFPEVSRPGLKARLRRGEIVVTSGGIMPVKVPGGLIHHWTGIAFIPDATIPQLFAVLQDYDETARYYSPEVSESRLIERRGDEFTVFMRLREQNVLTVLLDGLYDVKYGQLDLDHQFSTSRSLKIVEVAGDAPADDLRNAADLPHAGYDYGFLWRSNAYWRFEQVSDGVFVEFESISLSRSVPAGLGWLVDPFIRKIPRQSLVFTLCATRQAVLANQPANESQQLPRARRPYFLSKLTNGSTRRDIRCPQQSK